MDSGTTYDVRFHKTHVYKGSRVTTYYVRWTVAGQPRKQSFRTRALADSFRAELLSAARRGEAFCTDTGLPVSRNRDGLGMTWYELACSYSTMKWPYASPNHRRGIAEALTDATEVLIRPDGIPPARSDLRAALREWTFSSRITAGGQPPADLSPAIGWLEQNTIPLASLTGDDGPALARRVLDRISRRQDGTMAAANTANRKRMVLSNVMEYACEIKALAANPLRQIKWARPRTLRAVDPLVVLSSDQARSFLAEVGRQGPRGERLVAFFGCMYYAALRPEEVIGLRNDEHLLRLPDTGWGQIRLTHSEPRSGTLWTDTGRSRDRRELKHRAPGETRLVPVHPELVTLLRDHLRRFNVRPGRRVFAGPRGGTLAEWAYLEVFHAARRQILSTAEIQTPLLSRPYDLRHAAVSTWLNAGVPAAQVAEWAGHSVDVLLRVYAKCIAGQQSAAMQRIESAMRPQITGPQDRSAATGPDQPASQR
ncbi:MAG: tyrosine-type recombinase/integrase [Streptosporangiaceae bacterium]